MKIKIALIAVTILLILGGAFIFWKSSHVPKRKITVVKKAPTAREVARKRKFTAIQKRYNNPKAAIVIDDFGYNMNNLDSLFAVKRSAL